VLGRQSRPVRNGYRLARSACTPPGHWTGEAQREASSVGIRTQDAVNGPASVAIAGAVRTRDCQNAPGRSQDFPAIALIGLARCARARSAGQGPPVLSKYVNGVSRKVERDFVAHGDVLVQ
jgi:hypothetical protein